MLFSYYLLFVAETVKSKWLNFGDINLYDFRNQLYDWLFQADVEVIDHVALKNVSDLGIFIEYIDCQASGQGKKDLSLLIPPNAIWSSLRFFMMNHVQDELEIVTFIHSFEWPTFSFNLLIFQQILTNNSIKLFPINSIRGLFGMNIPRIFDQTAFDRNH